MPDDDRFAGGPDPAGQVGEVQPDPGIADEGVEKDGIHPRVAEEGREGAAVDIDVGADLPLHRRPEIDRIGDRHPVREELAQAVLRGFGEVGHGKPLLRDEIGGDDPRPAAEGQNGDPVLTGRRAVSSGRATGRGPSSA